MLFKRCCGGFRCLPPNFLRSSKRLINSLYGIDCDDLIDGVALSSSAGAMTTTSKPTFVADCAWPHRIMTSTAHVDGAGVACGIDHDGHGARFGKPASAGEHFGGLDWQWH
jgi:hypothetical protein